MHDEAGKDRPARTAATVPAAASEPLEETTALFDRLSALAQEFQNGTAIACRKHLDPQHLRFSPELEDVLYRCVRELLSNVRQHAQASAVTLSTSRKTNGALTVTVTDNGIGLTPRHHRPNPPIGDGFGLWSIEQRLGAFGGHLELEGDSGCRVTLVIPGRQLLTAAAGDAR